MLPYLQIGPLRLWTYGLMLTCGLWSGFYLFRAEVKRRGLPVDASALMLAIAVAGIICAKAYHVVVTLMLTEHQAVAWRDLFNFAGLAWNGGLIAGFAVLLWFACRKRVSIWSLLDAASPAAAVGYAFGRMGCFLAGDGDYGKPTNLPWGMSFPHGLVPTAQRVHPTPLYEIAGSLVLFVVLMRISNPLSPKDGENGAPKNVRPGTVFSVYLIGSGVFRFAVEFIRLNPPAFLGVTEAQVISLLSIVAGAALLARSRSSVLASAD